LAEFNEKLVSLLEASEWRKVWRLWMECKCLLVDAKVKDYVEDDEGVVDEEIRREEEIHEILSRYCSITAQSKPGE
jgi:hypothetical protein